MSVSNAISSIVSSTASSTISQSDRPVVGTWRAAWAGALAALRAPFDLSSDELDRQRMRDVNAQAFTAIDALLLTDLSPVSFALDRCRSDAESQ